MILGRMQSQTKKSASLRMPYFAILTVPYPSVNSWLSNLCLQKYCGNTVISGSFSELAHKCGYLLFIMLCIENLSHSARKPENNHKV